MSKRLRAENRRLKEEVKTLRMLLADKVEEPTLTSSMDIVKRFTEKWPNVKQEEFWVILLDNKHKVMDELMVTKGTLNQSLVHPREVFSEAIKQRAAAIVLLHCHPSGDPAPSGQDIQITKRLRQVGDLVGIQVLDHIIIGGTDYHSMVDSDTMPNF
jgi:DNA repair protein RadC